MKNFLPYLALFNFVLCGGFSLQKWTTTNLSEPKTLFAATSVGYYALFGGGLNSTGYPSSSVVDIFYQRTQSWLPSANLSHPRWGLAATSVQNMALFGGGFDFETFFML